MKKKKTKVDAVLRYLETHKRGITQIKAIEKFDAYRLADIVFKLKKRGYQIDTIMEESVGSYGKTKHARYVLRKVA